MTTAKSKKRKRQKSFPKAFKLDIGREEELVEEKWEVRPGKSLLMNPIRRRLFRYLCEYPCSSLSTIAKDFKISTPSMSWHLNQLSQRKLISEVRMHGRRLFYPQNMVDQSTIPILALLANSKINEIFKIIIETPGIAQKDLAETLGLSHQSINSYSNRLNEEKLINVVYDGKYTRYYPTKVLGELEIGQRKKLKEFRNWIIKAFKYDGLNPKLIRVTDRILFLQITSGSQNESIKLSVNPFFSTIQNRTRFLTELNLK